MMAEDITIIRWLLDTRSLWHGTKIKDAAPEYLSLLPQAEQVVILRKYHFADACMSLGSALIKRAYIVKSTGTKWHDVTFSRKRHERLGKPYWIPPPHLSSDASTASETCGQNVRIDFNVSHQKGIVLLVGIRSVCRTTMTTGQEQKQQDQEPEIAVDVVSPSERNDMDTIASTGLQDFISTFSEVFSEHECFALTYTLPADSFITLNSGQRVSVAELGRLDRTTECGLQLSCETATHGRVSFESDVIVEEKVRNFYALFSLKEAFVKLGGMGLAAEWIRECEFSNVRAPGKAAVARCSLAGTFGEMIGNDAEGEQNGFQITLHGEEVMDVAAEIQSFEEDYLFSTMVKPRSVLGRGRFPGWKRLSLERDIMSLAKR